MFGRRFDKYWDCMNGIASWGVYSAANHKWISSSASRWFRATILRSSNDSLSSRGLSSALSSRIALTNYKSFYRLYRFWCILKAACWDMSNDLTEVLLLTCVWFARILAIVVFASLVQRAFIINLTFTPYTFYFWIAQKSTSKMYTGWMSSWWWMLSGQGLRKLLLQESVQTRHMSKGVLL
jgi:hypothetical protein